MGRIEEIRERWEKATPGPWSAHDFGHGGEQEPSSIVIHTGKFDWDDINGEGASVIASMFWDHQEAENADAIAHAREDVPWMIAELQRLNHGRLCRKHYENGPDNEIREPAGCIICVINRAEKAEAERDAAQEELAELRAETADACTQLGCQAIDRTNEAEAHAHKLEEAIRRAVLLANDAIVRMRAGNSRVEAETGRPSTMRPFVFVDELIATMRPGIPNDQPVEHTTGERRDCAGCQQEADAEHPTPGGEG